MTAWLPSTEPTATPAPPVMSLIELQSAGWAVVEKTDAQKRVPGIAPYQNLERLIQMVNYRLSRNSAEIRSKTAYDSQRNHYEETCSKPRSELA
ncbi:MAG: hypothetical protein VX930_16480 [Pseudomonadota bacterium]|nr:hypothetical protein [Pseudomonadota bacterium]